MRGEPQDAAGVRQWFQLHESAYMAAAARAASEGVALKDAVAKSPAIRAWWSHGGTPMRNAADAVLSRTRTRKKNPVGLIMTAVGAAAAGCALTYATIGGPRGTILVFEEIVNYEGSIMLMRKSGVVGHLVDDFTGGRGFSHAAIDLGWVDDEGKAVCVESLALHGVRVCPIKERKIERIQLTAAETTYARGAAQALLTQKTPYRGRRGGLNCAEFVVACLPRSWRADLPKNPSPNDLALAWL